MTSKELKVLRDKISALSSGVYYDEIYQWFDLLDQVVQYVSEGTLSLGDCPIVYNDSGHNLLEIGDSGLFVWWSYYRMPSGRWEIICYLT